MAKKKEEEIIEIETVRAIGKLALSFGQEDLNKLVDKVNELVDRVNSML